jgi:hypothetical protein
MAEDDAEIEGFQIEVRLDVTVKAGEFNWFKPGASGRINFKSLPSQEQLDVAYEYLLFAVIDPQLSRALSHVNETLDEDRRKENGSG